MHKQVTEAGGGGLRGAAEPDEEDRSERHHLPEKEEGEQVAREDGPERTGHIGPGGDVLGVLLDVQAVKRADAAHPAHDHRKDEAQRVDPAEDERPLEERDMPEFPPGDHEHHEHDPERQRGNRQEEGFLQARWHQREQDAAEQQDQRGMNPVITHRSNPRGSKCRDGRTPWR